MLSKINFKILCLGFILLIIDFFIVWQKISYLYSISEHHRVISGLDDTFLGYIFYFMVFLLSLAIISHALSFNNKFSRLGKYIVDLFLKIYGKKKE